MVMRRIENEHGCTLSNSEDISTNGNNHAPPLLIFQMREDVAGLNFNAMIARIKILTTLVMIISRLMITGLRAP